MSTDIRPKTDISTLTQVLRSLPPFISVLIRGPHGIGKSQLAFQLGDHLGYPTIDRRLAQMTEGDVIGLPKIDDDITRFLPVVWFKQGCDRPTVLFLDEINRATPEVMNAAFQIVLDRELNGLKLHPDTRVICCVNDSAEYSVNEMDPALLSRFYVTDLEPTIDDWVTWATEIANPRIDPVLVDFIRKEPDNWWHRGEREPGGVYPNPRSWERVDKILRHAGMEPNDWAGKSAPQLSHALIKGIVGNGPAIALHDFVTKYQLHLKPEDLLDLYKEKRDRFKAMTHDSHVAFLDKVGLHCKENNWTEAQMQNLKAYVEDCLTDEDVIIVWTKVAQSHNMNNVKLLQKVKLTDNILKSTRAAQELDKSKKR